MTEESIGLNRIHEVAVCLAISTVFVIAGHLLVIQRHSQAEADWYKISPDARQYIAMVEGSEAMRPFTRRVAVPFLASMLPGSPERSLRTVTYSSVFVFYLVILLSMRSLGISFLTSILAVFSVFCCTAHLLIYQNPHIVDAFCHMSASIMLLCLLFINAVSYGGAAVTGVLSHEMALFTVPSFLATGRWRISIFIITLSTAVFVSTFLMISGRESIYELPEFTPKIAVEAYLAWGIAWIPIVAGLCCCRTKHLVNLWFMFFVVMSGAAIASVIAAGTVRMFAAIMPVATILIAFYLDEVKKNSRTLFVLLLLFLGGSVLFALPTNLMPSRAEGMRELEDFYFRFKYSIVSFHIAGIGLNVLILYRIRDRLTLGFSRNFKMIIDRFRPQ